MSVDQPSRRRGKPGGGATKSDTRHAAPISPHPAQQRQFATVTQAMTGRQYGSGGNVDLPQVSQDFTDRTRRAPARPDPVDVSTPVAAASPDHRSLSGLHDGVYNDSAGREYLVDHNGSNRRMDAGTFDPVGVSGRDEGRISYLDIGGDPATKRVGNPIGVDPLAKHGRREPKEF